MTDLNCKADGELPILKKKAEQEKHKQDNSKPKTNNHAHKKSLKRIEKFRKMQSEKTISMKGKSQRNKYSINQKNDVQEEVNDEQDKIIKSDSNKRKLDEVQDTPLKKVKKDISDKSSDVEKVMLENKSAVSKKKKKRKPRNNKFKPKPEEPGSQKDDIVELNAKSNDETSTKKKNKYSTEIAEKKGKKTIAVKVLDDEYVDEDLDKEAARKLKNRMKKLKRKEDAAKERQSKIIHGKFLERVPLKNIGETYEDVDYNGENGNEDLHKDVTELQVGNSKLDAKRLKKMVKDVQLEPNDVEEVSMSKKNKKRKKDDKTLSLKERMEVHYLL